MIPAEIVEKAAKAGFENYCDEPWEDVDPQTQANWCSDIDAALTPVYADIQAAALREAASSYQLGGWARSMPAGSDRSVLILGMAQQAINWLRARADELDGGTK